MQFYLYFLFQARERAARGEPEPVKKTPGTARRGRPPKTKPAGESVPDTATDDSQVRKTKPAGVDALDIATDDSQVLYRQIGGMGADLII